MKKLDAFEKDLLAAYEKGEFRVHSKVVDTKQKPLPPCGGDRSRPVFRPN